MDDHAHAHAHHAHVHEAEMVGDLPDDFLRDFADQWKAIEADIKQQNDLKAAMLQKVRAVQGRIAADALKIAMREMMQDPSKRVRKEMLSKIARRFLGVIEGTAFKSRFDQ